MKTADNSGQPPSRDDGGKKDLVAPHAGAGTPLEPEEPRTTTSLGCGSEGRRVSVESQSPLIHSDGKSSGVPGIDRDFTERKRAAEVLLESDRNLPAILENSPTLVFLKDLAGRYIYVNHRFEEEFGLTGDAVLGRTDLDIFPPEQAEAFRANDAAVLRAGVPCQFEEIARYTDGEHTSIVSKFPLFDANGRVSALCGIAVDITDRKRVETQLKDNEERLRLMLESVQEYAIFRLDPTGHVASWNTGAKRIKGYDAAEILGQHFSVFYSKEDIAAGLPEKVLAEALASGQCEKEGWRIRKDGSRFWANVAISAVRDASGSLRGYGGYVKVTRDMTERRRAEEALRKSNLTLKSIYDAAPVAMLGFDLNGRVTSWSVGAERMFGWTEAETLGKVCPVTPEDLKADFLEMIGRVAHHGPETLVRIRQKKSGERIYAKVNPAPMRDADGRVNGVLVIIEDITDKRRGEEAVSQAKERLTRLSRQLLEAQELERRRIARELHDQFGQSLVLLQLNLQKIQESFGTKDMAHEVGESITIVERLHEQARNLSLDLRPSLLDDLGLVPALRWHLDRLAQSSGLSVHFAAGASLGRYPAEVETTCFRIAQEALVNVSRHAQARHVSVNLAQDTTGLSLRITDDGIGFDVAAARRQATRGRSMGLLSMEERMELAGGELVIDSRPVKGTTICARFPLATIAALSTDAPIGDSGI